VLDSIGTMGLGSWRNALALPRPFGSSDLLDGWRNGIECLDCWIGAMGVWNPPSSLWNLLHATLS
jgi:hypothetical protein